MMSLNTEYVPQRKSQRSLINARMVLASLLAKNSKISREKLEEKFVDRVLSEKRLMRECVRYFFSLNYGSLTKPANGNNSHHELQQLTEKALLRFRNKVRTEAVLLLQSLMPNGKTLADCTGAECRSFGGWLLNVAEKVGAKRKVGDVLTETQLWKIKTS